MPASITVIRLARIFGDVKGRKWRQADLNVLAGYATEISRAVVDYAFNEIELPRLVAIVDAPNLASIRVMEKLGMHHLGRHNAHELEPRHPDIEVEMYALDNDLQL